MIEPFKLEEFFVKYEFVAPYLLCSSDAESWSLEEIVAMADEETKKLWNNLTLGYTESPGLPLLRKEIAKLYSTAEVLTFAGAEEAIYCLMRTLVQPKDHVIVIEPCYQSLKALPEAIGAEVASIQLDPKKGWRLGLDQLEKAFRPDTKLVAINIPHNPTGTLLDKEVFEGLIRLARERGAYILSDEVYRYLEIEENDRLPSMADAYEKGIALNVMSKSFGLAGLRIGWLASQDASLLKEVGGYKLYTTICSSAPSEVLALIALRAKEKILQRNRKIMLDNLAILDAFMERQRDKISWVRPQAGTVGMVKFLGDFSHEKLIEKTGVLIMPGSVFNLAGNYYRIGFGRKNMPLALNRFEEFLTWVR